MIEQLPEQSLCHYTTADAAFSDIIPRRRIRLGTLARMRDALENKEWNLGGAGFVGEAGDDFDQSFWGMHKFTSAIKETARLVSFTQDADTPAERMDYFGRGWGHPRMWEQYSDAHEGVWNPYASGKERVL